METVSAKGSLEGHQKLALVIKGNAPITILRVQLAEDRCTSESVSHLFHRWRMVLASLQGIVEIFGIQADPERTIRFLDISDARHPVSGLRNGTENF